MSPSAVIDVDSLQTRGPHFVWFCQSYLVQSIDQFASLPLDPEGWQREIIDEATTLLRDNAYLWSSVVIVLPRKNGKTTLLAAYALYRLLYDDGQPEILLAASSDKQAGRLFDACVSFIRQSAALSDLLDVRSYIGEIERADGGGKILRMSSSPERLHGYNPSLVICDEVAQWITPTLRKAWAALTTGGGARLQTQVFTISTAGEGAHRKSSILGRLIDQNEADGECERRGALTISRNYTAKTIVFNHSARTTDPKDLDAIKAANPASWITRDYLKKQAAAPELTEAEFLQLHACVWAEGESQYMPQSVWAGLARPAARLEPRDRIALGFDGSIRRDATALIASRLSDRLLVPLAIWERPPGEDEWQVPRGEVNTALRNAFEAYSVLRGYFDPKWWETDLERWAIEFGKKRIIGWPTSARGKMTAALDRFLTDCQTLDENGRRLLGHQGDATEFSQTLGKHVVNAQLEVEHGNKKLVKPGDGFDDRIDAGMAAILADTCACDLIAAGALTPRRKARAAIPR